MDHFDVVVVDDDDDGGGGGDDGDVGFGELDEKVWQNVVVVVVVDHYYVLIIVRDYLQFSMHVSMKVRMVAGAIVMKDWMLQETEQVVVADCDDDDDDDDDFQMV